MRPKSTNAPREAARVAAKQHGTISVAQLLEAGFSRERVKRWARNGLLHRELRGVYRFGHRAPSWEARYAAAVLAGGRRAALSGLAGAYLLGAIRGNPPAPEVTVPVKRSINGVKTRRRNLGPGDTTIWRGIRVTSVPRTLADLAAILPLDDLARACHEAEVRHHVSAEAALAAAHKAPGVEKLRAVVAGDAPALLSELERRFLSLLRRHRLPRPAVNRPKDGAYIDCRWPEQNLTVELDSYRFHHSRHAWEADRARDRAARARGDTYRRYTWRDVVEDPLPMLGDLASLLWISRNFSPATARLR
jgi:hypothetical protein